MSETADARSQNARRVTERYCTAWLGGDLDTVIASYADDIVLHYFGDNQLSGDHVGKDAALAALATGATLATRELLGVDDILVGDGTSVVVARERFTRDDDSHEMTRVLRYRIGDDAFVECWLYDEDQSLIDHLWR